MDLKNKKLGLMISTPPENDNRVTATRIAGEALAQGADVYIYLIDEGVKLFADSAIQDLKKKGVKLFACGYGAQQHHVKMGKEATWGGLVLLSNIIDGTDRFLSFN